MRTQSPHLLTLEQLGTAIVETIHEHIWAEDDLGAEHLEPTAEPLTQFLTALATQWGHPLNNKQKHDLAGTMQARVIDALIGADDEPFDTAH